MLLVSGASANHGNSLMQFIESARRWEPLSELVIYDLGLGSRHIDALRARGVTPVRFPFEDYPPHFDIRVNAGEYAWKPAIVHREIERYGRPVCWMDAGNVIRLPLLPIRLSLMRSGFYATRGGGPVAKWTHPGMLDALGLPQGYGAHLRGLSGGCVAFDPRVPKARALAQAWFDGAMDKSVIAPEGSSRSNHRQDQSLLTVLAYRSGVITQPNRKSWTFGTNHDLPEDAEDQASSGPEHRP